MADYYSILNKTISGLKHNTPELRQAVYAKARKAIEMQLRRLDPVPAEDVITAQLQSLEDAISVIESEQFSDLSTTPIEADPVPPPMPEQPEVPEPQVESKLAFEAASPPESATSVILDVPETAQAPELTPEPLPVFEPKPAPEPEEPLFEEPVVEVMPEPQVAGLPSEPSIEAPEPAVSKTPETGIPNELIEKAGPKKKRRLAPLLTILVLLLVIGGGGYAAWQSRDSISGMIASLTSSEPGEEAPEPPVSPLVPSEDETATLESPPADDKEDVRLGADGQEEVAEPVTETADGQTTEETQPPLITEETATQPVDQVETQEEAPVESAETPQATEETEPAAVPAPLGEVAYLYEEGGAGVGATRSNASVTWASVRVKPTEALPSEPVIVAKMEVPEKGMGVEINIKRNVDEALSASHIIEITFDIPESFAGGSIDNIARFVMKPTEEARGEPLVAVPVKVSDGYFLIALDNLEQAQQVNSQLMLNSSWIDIPMTYTSGKRALLTLEKGGSGNQVFQEAFEDWKNR